MASIFLKITPKEYLDLSSQERKDITDRSLSLDKGEMKLSSGGKAVIEINQEITSSLNKVLEIWENFYSEEIGEFDQSQFYVNSYTPANDFKDLKTTSEEPLVEEFKERGLVGFKIKS